MTTEVMNDREIRLDRMRYVKNTLSSRLCYLGILFNVLYFISIYKSDVGSWYYQGLVGASIIYNLVFMLFTFLASEGVKGYQKNFSWLLICIGLLQFVRIFILPMQAHQGVVKINGVETLAMEDPQFIRIIIYLVVSGTSLLAAAVINWFKHQQLANHMQRQNAAAKEAL